VPLATDTISSPHPPSTYLPNPFARNKNPQIIISVAWCDHTEKKDQPNSTEPYRLDQDGPPKLNWRERTKRPHRWILPLHLSKDCHSSDSRPRSFFSSLLIGRHAGALRLPRRPLSLQGHGLRSLEEAGGHLGCLYQRRVRQESVRACARPWLGAVVRCRANTLLTYGAYAVAG
jgi:hypothetical protein